MYSTVFKLVYDLDPLLAQMVQFVPLHTCESHVTFNSIA